MAGRCCGQDWPSQSPDVSERVLSLHSLVPDSLLSILRLFPAIHLVVRSVRDGMGAEIENRVRPPSLRMLPPFSVSASVAMLTPSVSTSPNCTR